MLLVKFNHMGNLNSVEIINKAEKKKTLEKLSLPLRYSPRVLRIEVSIL